MNKKKIELPSLYFYHCLIWKVYQSYSAHMTKKQAMNWQYKEKCNDLQQSTGSVHKFYVWVSIFKLFFMLKLKCSIIAQMLMCCEL